MQELAAAWKTNESEGVFSLSLIRIASCSGEFSVYGKDLMSRFIQYFLIAAYLTSIERQKFLLKFLVFHLGFISALRSLPELYGASIAQICLCMTESTNIPVHTLSASAILRRL